jgi:SnoaL-like protein
MTGDGGPRGRSPLPASPRGVVRLAARPCKGRRVDDVSAEQVVEQVVDQLNRCMRMRNVEGAVRMFSDDGVLFGSGADEHAEGAGQLRVFFTQFFTRSYTVSWAMRAPIARRAGRLVWFVASAVVVVHGDAPAGNIPYRLSGVLEDRGAGGWLFRLFNGAEPAAE